MKRNRIVVGAIIGASILVLGFLVLLLNPTKPTAATSRIRPPLTNATPSDVANVALTMVQQDFPVRSGTPQVVLTRSITQDDLPALDLPAIHLASIEKPPLMLVILTGDFSNPRDTSQGFTYVGYVFDLWAGSPTLTVASVNGGEFRKALNDPSLPIVATPVTAPPLPTFTQPIHYGEVAPTVRLPGPPPALPPTPTHTP